MMAIVRRDQALLGSVAEAGVGEAACRFGLQSGDLGTGCLFGRVRQRGAAGVHIRASLAAATRPATSAAGARVGARQQFAEATRLRTSEIGLKTCLAGARLQAVLHASLLAIAGVRAGVAGASGRRQGVESALAFGLDAADRSGAHLRARIQHRGHGAAATSRAQLCASASSAAAGGRTTSRTVATRAATRTTGPAATVAATTACQERRASYEHTCDSKAHEVHDSPLR